jgi:TonB family protein
MVLLSIFMVYEPKPPELIELDWGGSTGAPNQSITPTEAEPNRHMESLPSAGRKAESKVELPKANPTSPETVPDVRKPTKKKSVGETAKSSVGTATTSPRRRRSQVGAAGGSGKSTGYSIEWAGSGSRRLLSGRIPSYPEGTNKEMPVTLRFTVLPDGSVASVLPVVKSDMILEREATAALRTWRFDPLPPQFAQDPQQGTVTFIFKLE